MQKADQTEFIRLFTAAQPLLRRYVFSQIPDFHKAEDALQEIAVTHVDLYEERRALNVEAAEADRTLAQRLIRGELPSRRRKPRRISLRWLPPLAAAATLLAAVGLFLLRRADSPTLAETRPFPATDSFGHLVRTVGQVDVADHRVRTGPDSAAKVVFDNGSALFLDENTALTAQRDPATGALALESETGRTFHQVVPGVAPYSVRTAQGEAQVMGTRFLMTGGERAFVYVFDGALNYTVGTMGATIHGGQVAIPPQPAFAGGARSLFVVRAPLTGGHADWLEKLGEDPAKLLAQATALPAWSEPGGLGFDQYRIHRGQWSLRREPDGVRMIARAADDVALIQFGVDKDRWNRGTVEYQVRVLKPGPNLNANLCFIQTNGRVQMRGVKDLLTKWTVRYEWIQVRMAFEAFGEKGLWIQGMEAWPEANPAERVVFPENVLAPDNRDPVALGLSTGGGVYEFRHVRIRDGEKAGESNAERERVRLERMDLLAYYAFDEGQGNRIRNRSETGSGPDLTIGNPTYARWLPEGGLEITGPTDIAGRGRFTGWDNAWRKNSAMTFEFWVRGGLDSLGGGTLLQAITGDQSDSRVQLLSMGAKDKHIVCIMRDRSNQFWHENFFMDQEKRNSHKKSQKVTKRV